MSQHSLAAAAAAPSAAAAAAAKPADIYAGGSKNCLRLEGPFSV